VPAIVEFNLETRDTIEHAVDAAAVDLSDSTRIWWIDLQRRDPRSTEFIKGKLELAVDERDTLLSDQPPPGLVEREDSITMTLEAWTGPLGEGRPERITLHLTERYCLTVTAGPVRGIDEIRRTYRRHFRFAHSPGFVLFLVVQSLIENLAATIDPLEDECEALSERIYGEADSSVNPDLMRLRQKVLALRRLANQRRDTLMRLSARRIPVVTEDCRQSLGDVFTQAQALCGTLDSLRDTVSSLFDSFMAIQAQHMNQTMKVLTIFASVLMPMTLVAGIYGMNFQYMPELAQPWAYPA
jgi:magnesium transporter